MDTNEHSDPGATPSPDSRSPEEINEARKKIIHGILTAPPPGDGWISGGFTEDESCALKPNTVIIDSQRLKDAHIDTLFDTVMQLRTFFASSSIPSALWARLACDALACFFPQLLNDNVNSASATHIKIRRDLDLQRTVKVLTDAHDELCEEPPEKYPEQEHERAIANIQLLCAALKEHLLPCYGAAPEEEKGSTTSPQAPSGLVTLSAENAQTIARFFPRSALLLLSGDDASHGQGSQKWLHSAAACGKWKNLSSDNAKYIERLVAQTQTVARDLLGFFENFSRFPVDDQGNVDIPSECLPFAEWRAHEWLILKTASQEVLAALSVSHPKTFAAIEQHSLAWVMGHPHGNPREVMPTLRLLAAYRNVIGTMDTIASRVRYQEAEPQPFTRIQPQQKIPFLSVHWDEVQRLVENYAPGVLGSGMGKISTITKKLTHPSSMNICDADLPAWDDVEPIYLAARAAIVERIFDTFPELKERFPHSLNSLMPTERLLGFIVHNRIGCEILSGHVDYFVKQHGMKYDDNHRDYAFEGFHSQETRKLMADCLKLDYHFMRWKDVITHVHERIATSRDPAGQSR